MDIHATRTLTRISHSLWGDFEKSLPISEDILTSVGLLRLDEDSTMERALKMLIERAERSPPKTFLLQHPFFRLAPIERFLMTALHLERWSYARIARVLGIDSRLIAPWAWATRMKFCFQEMSDPVEYPRGPTSLGRSCPEYKVTEPWTQSFLDEELEGRERLFLQNHLMACDQCRRSLDLSRKMIFRIESMIPVREADRDAEIAAERLLKTWKAGESAFDPSKTTFRQSLIPLYQKKRVRIALAIAFGTLALLLKNLL